MPVSSTHPQYAAKISDWRKCRDAFEGQGAIKAAGSLYLPKLSGQTDADYNAYKTRALFYAITSKTISALLGMATQKPPVIKHPPELAPYLVDDSGVQLYEVLSTALAENLLMGRFGVLVDRPEGGGPPTLAPYVAESIINWRTDPTGNPVMVVLKETIMQQDDDDEFEQELVTQYRVLRLVDGVYSQHLYNEDEQLIKSVTPTNLGKTMDFIPFYAVNPFGLGFDIQKPPMLDIVDINISHYRTSADLEHGRHYTGLPVPIVSGVDGSTKLRIGSTTAWILPDPTAKAYYLEFTGQGLVSLEKALTEKQSQLASLSARLIGQSSNGSEAAETVRLRYMSETASLAAAVRAIEALINRVYRGLAVMESLDPSSITITLDKEFLDTRMSSADLRELVNSYISGGISKETLVFNLRRGDVLSSDRTDLEELAAIEAAKTAAEQANKVVSNDLIKPLPGVKS